MKSKIANFSAGPAAIPQEVLQEVKDELLNYKNIGCLLYTSPSPRDLVISRMPSSA